MPSLEWKSVQTFLLLLVLDLENHFVFEETPYRSQSENKKMSYNTEIYLFKLCLIKNLPQI